MLKNTKYFLLSILLAMAVIVPNSLALAQTTPDVKYIKGAACGTDSQGTCKQYCDPYENIDTTGPTSGNGVGECGLSNSGAPLTCCVPTKCGSNSTGVGTCTSNNSCSGTSIIGTNTSDCLPPKLCCVIPATPNTVTNEQSSVQSTSNQTNPFTGQNSKSAPTTPEGTTGGLVPCNGLDCNLCDLLVLIKNIINFLLGAIFALAGGFVVWGAIDIMTSGGNEGKVSSGRERITTAVFGIAIAMGAWLFLGTLLQVLTNSPSVLPWNSIQCSSPSLKLAPYSKGSDSACIALGGTCQDKSVTCDSGKWQAGKCLSISSDSYQCCLPTSSTNNTSGDNNPSSNSSSGNDSDCTSGFGGTCQDISQTPCTNGSTAYDGLCLSQSNPDYVCCIPNSTQPTKAATQPSPSNNKSYTCSGTCISDTELMSANSTKTITQCGTNYGTCPDNQTCCPK